MSEIKINLNECFKGEVVLLSVAVVVCSQFWVLKSALKKQENEIGLKMSPVMWHQRHE